jgi:hypothetical protein
LALRTRQAPLTMSVPEGEADFAVGLAYFRI